jgi:hypothetical protein
MYVVRASDNECVLSSFSVSFVVGVLGWPPLPTACTGCQGDSCSLLTQLHGAACALAGRVVCLLLMQRACTPDTPVCVQAVYLFLSCRRMPLLLAGVVLLVLVSFSQDSMGTIFFCEVQGCVLPLPHHARVRLTPPAHLSGVCARLVRTPPTREAQIRQTAGHRGHTLGMDDRKRARGVISGWLVGGRAAGASDCLKLSCTRQGIDFWAVGTVLLSVHVGCGRSLLRHQLMGCHLMAAVCCLIHLPGYALSVQHACSVSVCCNGCASLLSVCI